MQVAIACEMHLPTLDEEGNGMNKASLVFFLGGIFSTSCGTRALETRSLVTADSTDLRNYSASVVCKGSEIWSVPSATRDEAVAVIREAVLRAREENLVVKVTSSLSPHSYNPGLCPEKPSLILDVSQVKFIESVASDVLEVDAGPGLQIRDLQSWLKPHGRAFPVSPDFDAVTVAGAAATGSHHSSLKIPSSVADWVTQMEIVDGNGQIRTFTGSDLDRARVHLGLLGVVVSLRLKTVPLTSLQYRLAKVSDAGSSELSKYIENVVPTLDYGRIRWFPSQRKFLADELRETKEHGSAFDRAWDLLPPPLAAAGGDLISRAIQSSAGQAIASIPANVVNFSRRGACLTGRLRSATFNGTIQAAEGRKIGLLSDMISSSCTEPYCPWSLGLNSRSLEVGFPLKYLREWSRMIDNYVEETGVCFPGNGIYLRFSKASQALLGQAYGEDAVLAEIHIPQGTEAVIEAHSDVYQEIVRETVRRFEGRLHWAKNSTPYFVEAGLKNFKQAQSFVDLKLEMDPNGIFSNQIWTEVFVKGPQEASPFFQRAGCGVDRSCFCQVGESFNTCGDGGFCGAGALNPQMGVCRLRRW